MRTEELGALARLLTGLHQDRMRRATGSPDRTYDRNRNQSWARGGKSPLTDSGATKSGTGRHGFGRGMGYTHRPERWPWPR